MGNVRVFMAQQLGPALSKNGLPGIYYFPARQTYQTLNLLRPLALLLFIIALPALVFIRLRKPWVLFRLMLLG